MRINLRNQKGFAHIAIILLVAVMVLLASGTWLFLHNKPGPSASLSDTPVASLIQNYDECTTAKDSKMQETYPEVCVTSSGKKFTNPDQKAIPADWTWYANSELGIKMAYPKKWENKGARVPAWSGDPLFLITSESDIKIMSGCQGCEYTYNTIENQWYGWDGAPRIDIKPEAETESAAAFIIPMKGAMNCGTSTVAIHYKGSFIHAALGMCSPADFEGAFQPTEGMLWLEDVKTDLKDVLATITPS